MGQVDHPHGCTDADSTPRPRPAWAVPAPLDLGTEAERFAPVLLTTGAPYTVADMCSIDVLIHSGDQPTNEFADVGVEAIHV